VRVLVVSLCAVLWVVACSGDTDAGGRTYASGLDATLSRAADDLAAWARDGERDPAGLEAIASDVRSAARTDAPDPGELTEAAQPLLATARQAADDLADELERIAQADQIEVSDLASLDAALSRAGDAASSLREAVDPEVGGAAGPAVLRKGT
jgi:hypothetical protein